jgi:hypothetical protein
MKRLLTIILLTNLFTTTAYATCTAEICIDVVADPTSNQIVITASKKGERWWKFRRNERFSSTKTYYRKESLDSVVTKTDSREEKPSTQAHLCEKAKN